MKRLAAVFALVIIGIAALGTAAHAAEYGLVYDGAGVLSAEELAGLTARAEQLRQSHSLDVAVFVVEDMRGYDAFDAAIEAYNAHGYGVGEDRSGVMLFLSMAERDYAMIARGGAAKALAESERDEILDGHVLPLLAQDRYYDAFSAYFDEAEAGLTAMPAEVLQRLIICVVAALIIAGAVCCVFVWQMRSAKPRRTADEYVPEGGFSLRTKSDTFLYRTETRTVIQSGSGGGRGGHSSRGGFSGRSGKF